MPTYIYKPYRFVIHIDFIRHHSECHTANPCE